MNRLKYTVRNILILLGIHKEWCYMNGLFCEKTKDSCPYQHYSKANMTMLED